MLTLFTTAKAFQGHTAIIQRNALKSWKCLHPDAEVILFGNEEGAAEVCAEFGLRHEPHVERHHPSGMKYVNYIFHHAQAIARHDFLCYANCDIILLPDVLEALTRAAASRNKFLLIGQRWDTDIMQPIDFHAEDWAKDVKHLAVTTGFKQEFKCVDYFVFSRGLFFDVPALVNGRSYWDHWLVWKALASGAAVVDCTPCVTAVHQNHDHGYHARGKVGTHDDPLAMQNLALCGNGEHQRTILHATRMLMPSGEFRSTIRRRFYASPAGQALWKVFVRDTYPLRKRLGIRREPLGRPQGGGPKA